MPELLYGPPLRVFPVVHPVELEFVLEQPDLLGRLFIDRAPLGEEAVFLYHVRFKDLVSQEAHVVTRRGIYPGEKLEGLYPFIAPALLLQVVE
ncbi:hypothetical protein ES708_35100 [subsurface metagenome]